MGEIICKNQTWTRGKDGKETNAYNRLSTEETMLSNCGAGKTLEHPLDCQEIQPVHPKGNQSWIFIGRTDAEGEAPILWPPDVKSQTHWKRPWCWERLKAGGEGGDRGWDGWMVSLNQWMWVWGKSGRQWGTGKTGMLQSLGSQRVGHDWTYRLNNNKNNLWIDKQ